MEGIRHAQLLLMNSVPNVVQDALCHASATEEKKLRRGNLHNVTGIPEGVVESSQLGTVWRVRPFGDQHGCRVCREGETEADDEPAEVVDEPETIRRNVGNLPSGVEHVEVVCSGLDGNTSDHDGRAHPDGQLTTETVGGIWRKGVGSKRADVLEGEMSSAKY